MNLPDDFRVTSKPLTQVEALAVATELEHALGEVLSGNRKPSNVPVDLIIALIQFTRDASVPAVQPVMAGAVQPIGYINADFLAARRKDFEQNGTVMYAQCAGMATMPIFAAPVAPVTERDGFYEKLWRDFLSLQSGDIQLMGKEAARYRGLRHRCVYIDASVPDMLQLKFVTDAVEDMGHLDEAVDTLLAAPTPPEAREVQS